MPADEREVHVIDLYDQLMRYRAQLLVKEREVQEHLNVVNVTPECAVTKEKQTKSSRAIQNGVFVLPKIEK